MIRNFCALRLLRYASPPAPKTGESPVPGACKRTAAIKRVEITICKIVITISPIIYVLLLQMQAFSNRDKGEMLD